MSIFGSIVSAIFGSAKAAGSAVADAVTGGAAKPQPMTREHVEAQIQKVAAAELSFARPRAILRYLNQPHILSSRFAAVGHDVE